MDVLVWCSLLFVQTLGTSSESFEVNRIEVSPFYEPIILNDVVDIINEFENNADLANDDIDSNMVSDEKIEDLLSEYHHYLEKAQKQRKSYMEKTKIQNKVPLLKIDRFPNLQSNPQQNYESLYPVQDYYPDNNRNTLSSIDLFMPFNSKPRFIDIPSFTASQSKINQEKNIRPFNAQPNFQKLNYEQLKSSCFCKAGTLPCDCKCKQCIMPLNPLTFNKKNMLDRESILSQYKILNNSKSMVFKDKMDSMIPNALNIRIKVDVKLNSAKDIIKDFCRNHTCDKTLERDDDTSSEFDSSVINVPYSFLNFPIPMGLYNNKMNLKHDESPVHKLTIHKKKKSRLINGNKRHRKKLITFHNIKLEPTHITLSRSTPSTLEDRKGNQKNVKPIVNKYEEKKHLSDTAHLLSIDIHFNDTKESLINTTSTIQSKQNMTNEIHKIENSIETDFVKNNVTSTTETQASLRQKREAVIKNTTDVLKISINTNESTNEYAVQIKNQTVKNNNDLLSDSDLLLWVNNSNHHPSITNKNITALILERENRKVKMNISGETIKHDHTKALEQAVFGEVDWDDVDTVAPVFMSFVGKYIRGVLTFCSDNLCHSMKCADKICVHRTCSPNDRHNRKGHCTGESDTDSVATMESIMDLPSNIGFEIVDILQERMLGKMFGKVTLCITSKCISFVASKKIFLKSKCTVKQLNTLGHCENLKKVYEV